VTDGQTDGRTDRILIGIPRLHYMQRGKNGLVLLNKRNNVFIRVRSNGQPFHIFVTPKKQDAQLSQTDRAAGCVIVFAKSRRLELGDNNFTDSIGLSSTTVI